MMTSDFIPRHLDRASDNRFAHITPDNHSAPLWVASLLSLIYTVLVLAIRLGYTKWKAHTIDDIVIILAHVCVRMLVAMATLLPQLD